MKRTLWELFLLFLLAAAACAHNQPPTEDISPAAIEEAPALPAAAEAPAGPVLPADAIICGSSGDPEIPDRLKIKLFDTAVNVGVGRAGKLLQAALNSLGPETELRVDGFIGPKTRAALCGLSETAVLEAYSAAQAEFYHHVAQKPGQAKFLKGWLRRAEWTPE